MNKTVNVRPTTSSSKLDGGKRKTVIVTVAVVAVLTVIGGGCLGWNAYENHRLDAARADCATASESLRVVMNEYSNLKNGGAATASETTDKQVEDAKTMATLAESLKVEEPTLATCVADTRADYEEQIGKIEANVTWYTKHKAKLGKAVKGVEESRDAKTLADTEKLLKDSKGKVADEKTRDALDRAIRAKDLDAVTNAAKKVNASIEVKRKADAAAKAKAEAEAKAAAAAAAQAQTQQSWSSSSSSGSGSGYSNTWSGGLSSAGSDGGAASAPSGGASGASSSNGTNSDGWKIDIDNLPVTTNPSCASGGFCPIG